jgi:hypothetical protein
MSRAAAAVAPAPADEWLTVKEFCAEMKITRRTFDRWKALGKAPRFEPLGGHGPLRSKRSWVNAWALPEDESA